MAEGDKYCNCSNNNKSLNQILREMIVEDGHGNPQWKTNIVGNDTPNPDSGNVYNPLYTKNNTQNEYAWRDGALGFPQDNKPTVMGGWNDDNAFGAGIANTTTNQQWQTTDHGYVMTQIANAPWVKRHSACYGRISPGRHSIWGGDLMQGTYQRDVWDYIDGTGWINITMDWGNGIGDRVLMAGCAHNGYRYVFGGQSDYTAGATMFTDIWKIDNSGNSTFVGNLPSGLTDFSTGCAISLNGKIYLFSGGKYNGTGGTNFNNKVYVSLDDGASWITVGDLPSNLQNMLYATAVAFDGKVWFIKGGQNGVNAAGLYYSLDLLNWTASTLVPTARHATTMFTSNDETIMYIFCGNELSQLDGPIAVNAIPQNASLDVDAQAYINKCFPNMPTARQTIINNFFVGVKADNDFSKVRSMYLLGNYSRWATWIDLFRPTATRITENNLPGFTVDVGYTFGSPKFLDTNFKPSSDGGGIVLPNNLFHGVYLQTNSGASVADAGIANAPRDLVYLTKWSDNFTYIGTNWVGEEKLAFGLDTRGFTMAKRIGNNSTGYRNGVLMSGGTTVHTPDAALPNINDYIGCLNSNNVAGLFSSRVNSMRVWGSGNINQTTFSARVQTLATAIGFVQL